jgi:hypothetical protein
MYDHFIIWYRNIMNIEDTFDILDKILMNPDRYVAYLDLTQEYIKNDVFFRTTVSELWDFGTTWIFPDRRRLTSTNEEFSTPEQRIKACLLYYSIDFRSCQIDIRDVMWQVAILYHTCIVAKLEPNIIFRSIAQISHPIVSSLLINFTERPEEQKSMKAFSLGKFTHDDGVVEIRVLR